MANEFFAHIRCDNTEKTIYQPLREHCINTGESASAILKRRGLAATGKLAGYLHDAGKYKSEFQEYLVKSYRGEKTVRGSVIHTFAGVRYLLEEKHRESGTTAQDIGSELAAYAIGAHHGLFDLEGPDHKNGFQYRLESEAHYKECMDNYFNDCVSKIEIDRLSDLSTSEIEPLVKKILNISKSDDEVSFYMGLAQRLLLSAVIEGDRKDTALFMSGQEKSTCMQVDWSSVLEILEKKLNSFESITAITHARKTISERCRLYAEKEAGIVKLNIPTGGGKTLSSLRYAVAYAANHNKKHIILMSPLLSILEQNASVIRSFIDNDSLILEHHSNIIQEGNEDDFMREILVDSWDYPIIITTLVQFLNTLFSGKTSCIRRFHSLSDSVIVIDEVQTVPIKMLSLFNMTMNFLSEICGSTIVLCSATQPCFESTTHPLWKIPADIVPYDENLWSVFKRTSIQLAPPCSINEIADFILKLLENINSILIVCNKKTEAEELYYSISLHIENCYHLSASMCMEHRRETLKRIYEGLEIADNMHPVVCVSTQVIEAGVDISFDSVVRLSAGMDSVIQSAGRCNRNAEHAGASPVYILDVKDEKLFHLKEIKDGKDATTELLMQFIEDPDKFQGDLASELSINKYYHILYSHQPVGIMDYPVNNLECTLFDILGRNRKYRKSTSNYYMSQAFKTAGKRFSVFDDDSIDVIVPFRDGNEIIEKLQQCETWEYERKKKLITQAKQFTVPIYSVILRFICALFTGINANLKELVHKIICRIILQIVLSMGSLCYHTRCNC